MTRRPNTLDRLVERVMDLDSPAYGDERERAVFMESTTFGLTTGIYLGLLGAVVASLFGLVLLPVALLAMAILPGVAALWYARKQDVNLHELAENAGARSTMLAIVVFGSAMVVTFAAMGYTVFAGQAMLPAPALEVIPGEGVLGGMAQGAPVGGMLGGLATIIGGVHSYRRANRHRETHHQ